VQHEGFQALDMIQEVVCHGGSQLKTTRCPIRIDGELYKSSQAAPRVGQHSSQIIEEFSLKAEASAVERKFDE
jgi:crotonobetainyl-CoA:carnitine CoA-transferase CaiB-like acyl-CoA transferase